MNHVSALLHPALGETGDGISLEQARLTDQQALAVLFQGAALLAHLEHGGWCLLRGWETATVTTERVLKASLAAPGKGTEPPQALLLDLLRRVGLWSGRGDIAGKGSAKKTAGQLLARWRQHLAPESPDQAVVEILERAPFLWQPDYAEARGALVAEHERAGTPHLWIAGPGRNRRRLLAEAVDFDRLAELVRSPQARDLWEGYRKDDDPVELAMKGHSRQAVVCWRRRRPTRHGEVLQFARCLFDLGYVAQADEVLKRSNQFEARLLRLKCQGELGRPSSARQMLFRLAKQDLNGPQTLAVAEVAVRLLASKGDNEIARDWVRRAFRAAPGKRSDLRLRADLLASEAAWDRGDLEASARYLARARAAREHPELGRRWHEVRSLLALGHRDGAAVTEHSAEVLKYRRRMTRIEAGRRWNDLAYGRLLSGDLAGAERAMQHALGLFHPTESTVRNTLGLANLAGIRLRRGLADGVAEILEASTAINVDNPKGRLGDLGLWVRLELARGRPKEALERCREAFEMIGRHDVGNRQLFELLSARALGWLGSQDEAAARLARVSPEILFELEPEERPAVWALAGDAVEAARQALDTPYANLWSAHAAGVDPSPRAWEALDDLEDFRAARLVFDYLMVAPESVPPVRIRRSIDGLRRVGAHRFASRLEKRFFAPWRAVERYFDAAEKEAADVADLFESAGYPEARIFYSRGADEIVVKAGKGGDKILRASSGDGLLVLEADRLDDAIRALFRMIRQGFVPPAAPSGAGDKAPPNGRMLGESPAFLESLGKLDRLARGELPILILGASGTGKELAARRVHEMSPRGGGPFQAVNCAGLPEVNLAQSEIFGHVRGAYTGAHRDRPGIFERARRGTVFLDEIGDLPLELQGKLLRILQEGELLRLGDELVRKVDVRVVAATHRDLRGMVREGTFRNDLYYRLHGATVELPALSRRDRDVLLLARHFTARHWKRLAGAQGPPPKISPAAEERLSRHDWPGNVRELNRTMERATTLARGGRIRVEDLGLPTEEADEREGYHEMTARFGAALIKDALEKNAGNQARAARSLKMTRQAFSYHARKLKLI